MKRKSLKKCMSTKKNSTAPIASNNSKTRADSAHTSTTAKRSSQIKKKMYINNRGKKKTRT